MTESFGLTSVSWFFDDIGYFLNTSKGIKKPPPEESGFHFVSNIKRI